VSARRSHAERRDELGGEFDDDHRDERVDGCCGECRRGSAQGGARGGGDAAEAHAACTTDADCVTVGNASSCHDSCFAAANKDGVVEVEKAIDHASKVTCAGFEKAGCTVLHPPCLAAIARCQAGRCTM
jgi:hypothetical protein